MRGAARRWRDSGGIRKAPMARDGRRCATPELGIARWFAGNASLRDLWN